MIHTSEMSGAKKIQPGLVTPALQNLAKNGFPQAPLQQVERDAMRAAAQWMHRRQAEQRQTTNGELAGIVNAHLGAGQPGASPHADPYLTHALQITQIRQRASGIEHTHTANALARADLDRNTLGAAPVANASNWLAQNLFAMNEVADEMRDQFPEFADALEQRASTIIGEYPERENLLRTLEAMSDVRNEYADDSDSDDDTSRFGI